MFCHCVFSTFSCATTCMNRLFTKLEMAYSWSRIHSKFNRNWCCAQWVFCLAMHARGYMKLALWFLANFQRYGSRMTMAFVLKGGDKTGGNEKAVNNLLLFLSILLHKTRERESILHVFEMALWMLTACKLFLARWMDRNAFYASRLLHIQCKMTEENEKNLKHTIFIRAE